ncbi:hypothetical protein PSTG_20041, partial [Puccinia striiformis f. sp. tritici PST-78]
GSQCGCWHITTTPGTTQTFGWGLSTKHKDSSTKKGPKFSGIRGRRKGVT